MKCKGMQFGAKEPKIIRTNYVVTKIIDGDGFFVKSKFNKNELEVRLLGIDAPEIKDCRKLRQDERETHLPAQFLIELGFQSKQYLQSLLPPHTEVTLVSEHNNEFDLFNRLLAYTYIDNDICINELLIKEGYVKPYDKFYCEKINKYRQLNFFAKTEKVGLYQRIESF